MLVVVTCIKNMTVHMVSTKISENRKQAWNMQWC